MFTEQVHSRADAREASRARVLAAAEELFVQRGFADTTIRQVAGRASVSVGTVMAVADKDGLLVAIFDRQIAAFQLGAGEPSSDVASDPSTDSALDPSTDPGTPPALEPDPVGEIMRTLGTFVRFFATHSDMARAYMAILVRGTHASMVFTELARALVQQVSTVLIGAGRTTAEAASVARLIHRSYIGELFIWAAQGDSDPHRTLAELETTVRSLVDGKAR